jgi:hypothetical protein
MNLIKVVVDNTMMVSGFERHTLMCSVCYDIERRFIFNNQANGQSSETVVPPVSPNSTVFNNPHNERDSEIIAPTVAAVSSHNQPPPGRARWGFLAKIRDGSG